MTPAARHSPARPLPAVTKAPRLCRPGGTSLLPGDEVPLYQAMPLQCQIPVTSARASWLCRARGDALPALRGWVPTAQLVLTGASAEMLILYQGGWGGQWSLQGRAKGCQSKTAGEGERWPGSGWDNQGLRGLRDAHQDSAKNCLCGPSAQAGAPTQGRILVEESPKWGQAFCSSLLLVSISHPALAGGRLGAVWAGGSLPTAPPRQLLLAAEGLRCPAWLWGFPCQGGFSGLGREMALSRCKCDDSRASAGPGAVGFPAESRTHLSAWLSPIPSTFNF